MTQDAFESVHNNIAAIGKQSRVKRCKEARFHEKAQRAITHTKNDKTFQLSSPNTTKKKQTQTSVAAAAAKISAEDDNKKTTQTSVAAAAIKITTVKTTAKKKPTEMSTIAVSAKISADKLTMMKLNAYEIDWIEPQVTTLETMKFSKANKIDPTQ